VGALFALSFDTMSQAAVFSMAATTIGGWTFGVVLGLVFMLGMMVTDGVNGLWISRLLRAADRRALVASRVMGFTVGGLSLLVGLFGLAKWFIPEVGDYSEGRELWFGLAVVAVVMSSYLLALRLAGEGPVTACRVQS
jgi:high-affinity nickel-transport protein